MILVELLADLERRYRALRDPARAYELWWGNRDAVVDAVHRWRNEVRRELGPDGEAVVTPVIEAVNRYDADAGDDRYDPRHAAETCKRIRDLL